MKKNYTAFISATMSLLMAACIINSNVFAQTGIQKNVPALKDVYKNDFYIGCLLSYAHVGFSTDPYVAGQSSVVDANGGYLIKYHMNSMSPGNWMKSTYIVDINGSASAYSAAASQSEKDSIDVNPRVVFNGNITAQLNWAKRQGFTFRGHTLVWHSQTPGTAFFRSGYTADGARLSKEKMTDRMENYIKEVIRIIHEGWPGLLSAFDVVNEAVLDNGNDRTDSEWYTTFGDNSFIMKAFEFARKYTVQYGETQIKLYYNDYNTSTSSKADGIVRILTPIYQAGLLDGIGMQEHDQYNSPSAVAWIASYEKFYPICSEMAVTELDVKPSSTTLSTSVLATQANQYGQLFKCFVERSYFSGKGKIISVCKDGLNDQWAFVANASLWDKNDQCKPAFYASVNVGLNYHSLDSLIAVADTIQQRDYTDESWLGFSGALTSAKNVLAKNYSYTTSAADSLGNARNSLNTAIAGLTITDIEQNESHLPSSFALYQNYPNPFNPSTTIRFQIPVDMLSGDETHVTLKVCDVLGCEVATLVNEEKSAGTYEVKFEGSKLPTGVYVYRLAAGSVSITKKLMLIK